MIKKVHGKAKRFHLVKKFGTTSLPVFYKIFKQMKGYPPLVYLLLLFLFSQACQPSDELPILGGVKK